MSEHNAHYQRLGIQPMAVIESWMSPEQTMGFLLGNVIKYVGRFNLRGAPGKGGLPDLEKAKAYLEMAIALEEQP